MLTTLTTSRKNDAYLWYHLAEAAGLAGDIPEVHWSRAEYFILTGNLDQALKQLDYSLSLIKRNFQQEAKVKSRIKEIQELNDKKS